MKSKSLVLVIALSLMLTSCSWLGLSSDSSDEPKVAAKEESEEIDLFADNELQEEKPAEKKMASVAPASEEKSVEDEDLAMLEEEGATPPPMKEERIVDKKKGKSTPVIAGKHLQYTGKKGDTLMLIAFNLYGDYRMWHKIKAANPTLFKKSNTVASGMEINYPKPMKEFTWAPDGTPYLILGGDTLGKISSKVYGTPKEWKMIWNNNKPLIHNPNLIFAGFTLYYKDKSDLLASN